MHLTISGATVNRGSSFSVLILFWGSSVSEWVSGRKERIIVRVLIIDLQDPECSGDLFLSEASCFVLLNNGSEVLSFSLVSGFSYAKKS